MKAAASNSIQNSEFCTVAVDTSLHTVDFQCEPRDGFFEWLTDERVNDSHSTSRTGWLTQKSWVPQVGLFIEGVDPTGVSRSLTLSTSNPTEALPLLAGLVDVTGITRVDVALDYHADLSGCDFSVPHIHNLSVYRNGGKLDSVTFGSRKSKRFIRIYNKAAKAKIPGPLWRVEAELRSKGEPLLCLPIDTMDDVSIQYFPPIHSMRWPDEAQLHYAHDRPAVLRGLSSTVKQRQQALRDKYLSLVVPQPGEAYRDSLPELSHTLNDIRGGM
jgi:hypothetical protein